MSDAVAEISETNKELVRRYTKEMALRKKYHNQLVELRGAWLCLNGSGKVARFRALEKACLFLTFFLRKKRATMNPCINVPSRCST